MTHPSLEGFNEPACDRLKREKRMPSIVTSTGVIDTSKPMRRSRSARAECIETLLKYRTYVSHNDVALHHRYKEAMLGSNVVQREWRSDYDSWQVQVYYKTFYASMFRECLYYDMFLRAEKQINSFKRGQSVAIVEESFLYLIITPLTFHLDVSLKRRTDQGVF